MLQGHQLQSFLHPALFFLAGIALLLLWRGRGWRWIVVLPPLAAVIAVAAMVGGHGSFGEISYLGLTLTLGRVDALSIIFAHVFAIQALLGFIFAYHVEDKAQHVFASLYVAGGFGCVFAGDYLTLFVFWELMSVGSTFLVWLNRTPASTAAGFRYFLFHILGGLFLLAGMLLRHGDLGTFAFTHVDPASAQYYDWLILIGFCVNAAVAPLHAWLPDAYPNGTVTGSVFMSAYTTKTAVYVLARGFYGWEALAVAGAVMAVYGVLYATIENNTRKILSYHIVSQVGYMVAGIGIGTAMTVDGACAHAYAHILYKGLLFMSAGALLYATGTQKLTELGGLASRLPILMLCYMAAGLSISGMPLFNGFISKNITIAGAFAAHHPILGVFLEVAAVGTFLSVGIKLPYFAFWGGKPANHSLVLRPLPRNMVLGMVLGAGLCLFTGLYPQSLYGLLPYALDGWDPFEPYKVLQAFLLLGFTGLGFYLFRKIMKPHAQLNLDFDYIYRLAGRALLFLVSAPLAAIDAVWSEIYARLGLRGLMGSARGAGWFDRAAIDGVVDGSAYTVRGAGRGLARVQTGRLQDYLALATLIGLCAFALAWILG
ncbi:MAG: Na(+)/H(+) antiporter subunit D [Thermodesulfobacteriota bacterium]